MYINGNTDYRLQKQLSTVGLLLLYQVVLGVTCLLSPSTPSTKNQEGFWGCDLFSCTSSEVGEVVPAAPYSAR